MYDLIKARELPEVIGVPYRKVHQWCTTGMIPTFRPPTASGRGGMIFVQYQDVHKFLQKHSFPAKVVSKFERKFRRK